VRLDAQRFGTAICIPHHRRADVDAVHIGFRPGPRVFGFKLRQQAGVEIAPLEPRAEAEHGAAHRRQAFGGKARDLARFHRVHARDLVEQHDGGLRAAPAGR